MDAPKPCPDILVIDDEEMILRATGDMLEHLGHTPCCCINGEESLEALQKYPDSIKLLILDFKLPDVPSSDILDFIKKNTPHIKTVLATGYASNDPVTASMVEQCEGFIQKPFGLKELRQVLEDYLP